MSGDYYPVDEKEMVLVGSRVKNYIWIENVQLVTMVEIMIIIRIKNNRKRG